MDKVQLDKTSADERIRMNLEDRLTAKIKVP
jgi:hypothetical protein